MASHKADDIEQEYGKPINEIIKEKYPGQNQSQIANELGVSRATIKYWIEKEGIEKESHSQTVKKAMDKEAKQKISEAKKEYYENKEYPSPEVKGELQQILYGTLLGDGHLRLGEKSRNANLYIEHSKKQKKYALWKKKKLGDLEISCYERERTRKGSKTESVVLYSKSMPVLTELHNKFYQDGEKVIPDQVLNNLDWKAIAVLYMDDGSVTRKGRGIISVEGLKNQAIRKLSELLQEKGLDNKIDSHNRIYLPARSSYKLSQKIKDHVVDGMKYKLYLDADKDKLPTDWQDKWSEEEIQYLKNNYQDVKAVNIAEELNRSKPAIYSKANKLNINKRQTSG